MKSGKPIRICIFASGNGTNAERIISEFRNSTEISVVLVLTGNDQAGAIHRARNFDIPVRILSRSGAQSSETLNQILEDSQADLLVLAGYLKLIPPGTIAKYANRIVNIHPSLLPKYGGKGMYGLRVHEAVLKNREKESGITIHFVNDHYDQGEIISQKAIVVNPNWTPEELAAEIHLLEHKHYPGVISEICLELLRKRKASATRNGL